MTFSARKKYNFKHRPAPQKLVPNIIHVSKDKWLENKKPMFRWAEIEEAKHGYKPGVKRVLDMFIANSDPKGVSHMTLETLHNKMIYRYGKAAPSRRTLDNYIALLVGRKSIKRSTQKRVKSLITTRLRLYESVKRCTQNLRTEYISPHIGYIYGGGDGYISNVDPSLGGGIIRGQRKERPNAPPGWNAGALGVPDPTAYCEVKKSDRGHGKLQFAQLKSQLKKLEIR